MKMDAIERALVGEAEASLQSTTKGNSINSYNSSIPKRKREWPILGVAARYGLVGKVVSLIEPHTEADAAAILVQLLSGFGVLIGRTAHFRIGADYHYLKLFVVIVGLTASGRKGTAWSEAYRVLSRVDPSFAELVQNGLSSGEGLIYHVRDEVTEMKPRKKSKLAADEWPDELIEVKIDAGSQEKRCMVIEPEFARVLKVIKREGNTLSSVIRQSWDNSKLSVMTKNPIKATDAHIGINGHITQEELLRNLQDTETSNGFANRFLWACAKRSKYLPEGGNVSDSELIGVISDLKEAAEFARNTGEITRSQEATVLWRSEYRRLSDGYQGLLGSVTSRATAQVMRIACLYAILDKSPTVEVVHLRAALAVWKYCEDSAKYIFGETLGDKVASEIVSALKQLPEGMSRTDISNHFNRNRTSMEINAALEYLLSIGRIEVIRVEGSGRTAKIVRLCDELNEQNEIRPTRAADNSCNSSNSFQNDTLPQGQGDCIRCEQQGLLDSLRLCIECDESATDQEKEAISRRLTDHEE